MRHCPKCRSSMLIETETWAEGGRTIWKCIGCGREILCDPEERAEHERLLANVTLERR